MSSQVLVDRPKAQFKISANVKLYVFPKEIDTAQKAWWATNPWGYAFPSQNEAHARVYLHDQGDNLVPSAGANQIIDLLCGVNTLSAAYCGVGSGTNTPAAGDTDLQTPITPRLAITSRFRSGTGVGNFNTFFTTADGNGTWNETGLFTAVSGVILIAHRLFASSFTKSSSNTATVNWTLTVTPI